MARICKVLIVEDDDSVRDLLGDLFDHEGYHFALVDGGGTMREALTADDYDVTIIDISLRGGEDGLALAAVAHEFGCGVILTTGDPQQINRAKGSQWLSVMKPFRLRDLIELVERVLKETQARCVTRNRRSGSGAPTPL